MSGATKKIRSVPVYLKYLERAGKSPRTIRTYRDSLDFYARFLEVPLDELHLHMTVDNLMDYLETPRVKGMLPNSKRTAIASISRYMKVNGVEFDELEMGVVKAKKTQARQDKPADLHLLQKMMDIADIRMKALITFLVSTGCRMGETSRLRLSDMKGPATILVPDNIAKNHHGGYVYLTKEAEEYMALWLAERDTFILEADRRTGYIPRMARPVHDDRIFASSTSTLQQRFMEIYDKAEGDTVPISGGNKRRRKVTAHSCRAYFRTNMVSQGFPIDMAENVLRHEGYLTSAYVRMDPEVIERAFHENEDALYITRPDRRVQDTTLAVIEKKNKEMEVNIDLMRKAMARMQADLRSSQTTK